MAAFARTELDLLGLARQDNQAAVQLFVDPRRQGCSGATSSCSTRRATRPTRRSSSSFLLQYYARRDARSRREVLRARPRLPRRPRELEAFLERRGAADRSTCPSRSAARSASSWPSRPATPAEMLAREQARWLADQGKTLGALEELADALGLPGRRCRIECYDITNFQGSETVGSMVVFEDGKPRTGEYRRFRIRTVEGPNDFASHQEVLRRRFRRARPGEEGSAEERRWAMPDLVIIDGGKGQVSAAKEVLDELGPARPAARRAGQGARGAVPAGPRRADRPAADVAGALPRPAHPRRGPPLRDHLPPRPARARRRSARRSTTCPASGRSAGARCCASSARSKRVREAPVEQIAAVPGIGPRARGEDQGDARGLTPAGSGGRPASVPCIIRRSMR